MTDLELRMAERTETDYLRRFRARVRAGFDPRRAARPNLVVVTSVEPRLPDRGNLPGFYSENWGFRPGFGWNFRDRNMTPRFEIMDFFACTPVPHYWSHAGFVCGYRDYGTAGPHKPEWRISTLEFPLVEVPYVSEGTVPPIGKAIQWKRWELRR